MYSWELVVFWQGFKRLITESRAKMVIKHYVFISFVFIFDSGFDWRWVSPTFLMYFTILCIVFMHLVSLISYLLCFQLKLYSLHTILLFLNLTTANKYNFLPFDFILNIQISKPSPEQRTGGHMEAFQMSLRSSSPATACHSRQPSNNHLRALQHALWLGEADTVLFTLPCTSPLRAVLFECQYL